VNVRSIGATLAYAYGDAGFNPETYHLTFPLPPSKFKSRPLAAVPLAFIDHSEDEYDSLIEAKEYISIRQTRTILVITNSSSTSIRKEGGWQFRPWADLLIDGVECRIRSYNFRPLRSDGPLDIRFDPSIYSYGLSGWGRRGPNNIWPKFFLPDRSVHSAPIQFKNRTDEIQNTENLLLWAVTRGLGLRTTHVVNDAEYSFDLVGTPRDRANLPIKLTIKPTNAQDWLIAEITGPEFTFSFLFEPYGRDMNEGIQGVFIRTRLKAQGDRAAFRNFLQKASETRPNLNPSPSDYLL